MFGCFISDLYVAFLYLLQDFIESLVNILLECHDICSLAISNIAAHIGEEYFIRPCCAADYSRIWSILRKKTSRMLMEVCSGGH